MLKVGVTGGIGSGKSLVCDLFSLLGISVYRADDISHELTDADQSLKKELILSFGEDIYKNGHLDREKVSNIVFSAPEALKKINSIIHPAIRNDLMKWLEYHTEDRYVVVEAAVLFEAGFDKDMDHVVSVSAPKELRIRRVMHRDGVCREDVLQRMSHQMKEEKRNELADEVLINDEQKLIIPQVLSMHRRFSG